MQRDWNPQQINLHTITQSFSHSGKEKEVS